MALTIGLAAAGQQCNCPGDCNGDCVTDREEALHAIQAVFDFDGADCAAADLDGDSVVVSAELLRVYASVVDPGPGCGVASATPTAKPTTLPTATRSASRSVPPSATITRTPFPSSTSTPSRTPTPTRMRTATVPPTKSPTGSPIPSATPVSEWISLAPLALGPRQEVGVAAIDNVIYVVGGFDGEGRVEAYDVEENTWRRVADLPAARNHVGVAALGGRIYCVGGFAGTSFQPTTEVYRYNPAVDRWDEVAPLPTARGALAVAVVGGRLHAIGGDARGSIARHDRYDPATNSWARLASLPNQRNHLAAGTIDGRIYVVGGRGGPDSGELDRYDPMADEWDVLAPMPTARSGIAAVAWDGRLVVLGGEVNPNDPKGVFPEVEMYDPGTAEWKSLDSMAVPRHGIGAAVVGDLIYVPGGATKAGFEATDILDALRIER